MLSVLSSFESKLTDLQNSSADVSSKAAGFVDAVNLLQSNISNLRVVSDAFSNTTIVDQSFQTLNAVISSLTAPDSQTLNRLQGIGIDFQMASLPTNTSAVSFTLSIDQTVLAAAIQNDLAGTAAVLAQATQSLLDQSAGLKDKIVGTLSSLGDLSRPGLTLAQQNDLSTVLGLNNGSTLPLSSVATDLLQNLPADVVLNDLELSDLDLAKVGLDASTIVSDDTVRRGSLAETLLSVSGAGETTVEELLLAVDNLIAGDNVLTTPTLVAFPTPVTSTAPTGIAAVAETTPATIALALPATNTTPVTSQGVTNTSIVANTEAVQADRSLSVAALALQNLLNNPALRAINNNRFDAAYSAIVAASHLNDFVSPSPVAGRITQYQDTPAPVEPVIPPRGIAYYREATGENWR